MSWEQLLNQFNVALVMMVVGLITTLFKTLKFVQEGEQGCRLIFGRVQRDWHGNPVIIQPGFVLLIPWVQTLKRRHV